VILGDPAIPWPEVHTAQDFSRYEDRDGFFAEVTGREVLDKGRRGLLVSGSAHWMEKGPLDPAYPKRDPNTAERLNGSHPGALFTLNPLRATEERVKELGLGEAPALLVLGGTELGGKSYSVVVPRSLKVRVEENGEPVSKALSEMPWPPMREVVDGLLWLGADTSRVDPSPDIYLDPAYQKELRRRAAILSEVHGFEYEAELQDLVDEALRPR
jgi:hypothetical protein